MIPIAVRHPSQYDHLKRYMTNQVAYFATFELQNMQPDWSCTVSDDHLMSRYHHHGLSVRLLLFPPFERRQSRVLINMPSCERDALLREITQEGMSIKTFDRTLFR